MTWENSAITITTLLPLVGALVIAVMPKEKDRAVRLMGILVTGAAFVLAVAIAIGFDYGRDGLQNVLDVEWITVIGVKFHVGIDGISLPLYVLTFLRSAAGYAEIQRCIRGQSGHVYREQVQEIRIPKPDKGTIESVADAIEALTRSLKSQDDTQIALAEADALAAQLFPSSVRKPIIAR